MTAAEVGIVAADGARLERFYVDGLQFRVEATYEFPQGTVRRLRRDDARCKLFQPADGVIERPPTTTWHDHPGIGYGALHVDDAEAEVSRAVAAGAELLEGVVSHRPGARYALIRDPEGNVWEILEEH